MTTTRDEITVDGDVAGHEHGVTETACVERFLEQISVAAIPRVVPSTQVVVSVRDGDTMRLVASSNARAEACERAAQDAATGASAAARREGRLVVVPDVADDTRWPRWARLVSDAGFRSVVAVPGRLDGDGELLLVLYSPVPDAWDAAALTTATHYAHELAHALTVCLSLIHI